MSEEASHMIEVKNRHRTVGLALSDPRTGSDGRHIRRTDRRGHQGRASRRSDDCRIRPRPVATIFIVTFLGFVMGGYADAKELGTVSCAKVALFRPPLPGRRRFAPRCLSHSPEARLFSVPKVFPGARDLVVEVLSPSTRAYDLGDKRLAYHDAQIEEIWLVDDDNRQLFIDRKRRGRLQKSRLAARSRRPVLPASGSIAPGCGPTRCRIGWPV